MKQYNLSKREQEFYQEMENDILKYQKQYGFKLGENNSTHNNEADAFRHAYMQTVLSQRYGVIPTWFVSKGHEIYGNLHHQDPRENKMDEWNNKQGQQIYREIQKEYPDYKSFDEQRLKDIAAQKVVQRMRAGQLITELGENKKPSFTPMPWVGGVNQNGKPLGFAADIKESDNNLYGYKNPLTGDNRIFTREDVGNMSDDEFDRHEKEIGAQTKAFKGTMPTNNDLFRQAQSGGGVVYINSYIRSDGRQVRGHYRSL